MFQKGRWSFNEMLMVFAWTHTEMFLEKPPKNKEDFPDYFFAALESHTKKEWMRIIKEEPEVVKLGSGKVWHHDRKKAAKERMESNSFFSIICGKPRDKRYVKECEVSL